MSLRHWFKTASVIYMLILSCLTGFADDGLYREARSFQREGMFDEAISAYRSYLTQPKGSNALTDEEMLLYTDALVQLMNAYQSKGEPDACITDLQEIYNSSPTLQKQCLRDFYSVMGYALSRTERMKEAEETMLKTFSISLQNPTPERYFRDYAYAAAVFYSNPDYQKEVVNWCQEAIRQAESGNNKSGKQWVTAMLGSIYKRNGALDKALELFQQSKEEALEGNDGLGVLNSLHKLTDLFLYWHIPEYANLYASEALQVQKGLEVQNPMVSAQTYINKGRALQQLGATDSIPYFATQAQKICASLPYNSGMVDVNLLNGIYLTQKGGDSLDQGIKELEEVARHGTVMNRAKAYHQLAQTYLKYERKRKAEVMLDSLYALLTQGSSRTYIHIDYKPIINHYLKGRNQAKLDKYVNLMLQEQQAYKDKKVNYNLVEAIIDLQTGSKIQESRINQLKVANQHLWFMIYMVVSATIISFIVMLLLRQKREYRKQIRQADEKLAVMVQKLNQSNVEKEMIAQEINAFLKDKENRQELETLTPHILKEEGETKFRQCFELLYPLFLHRLREKVPSVTRREELLSMLIILKQDNKTIAELMAIAPRSVLMLRHRFRQKIGIATEYSLENFIEDTLVPQNKLNKPE